MAEIIYLTQGGYDKIQNELEDLKGRRRSEIVAAIAEAREKGDLSENAEYHAAKNEQGMLEMKIFELEQVAANARVLDENLVDTSKVVVLTKVTIKNLKSGRELTYKLVSESEADLSAKKISISSPIGQGLLGKKVGDIAEIQTPAALMQFEIIEITI